MPRALSLRWRLAAIYAAVVVAALFAVLSVVQLVVARALVEATADRLEVEAGLIAADQGRAGVSTTTLAASDLATLLGGQATAVLILDESGSVLAGESNNAERWVVDARLSVAEYQQVFDGQQVVNRVLTVTESTAQVLVVAAPIRFETPDPGASPAPIPDRGPPFTPPGQSRDRGQGVGQGVGQGNTPVSPGSSTSPDQGSAPLPPNALAQLAVSLGPIDDTLTELRGTLIMVGLLAFATALAVALLVTSVGLRPLARVASAADRVARGDLSARAELPSGTDEIGRLGRSFDTMAEQVEDAFASQRQFAADASHELRSPLTVLGGYVDLLKTGGLNAPETTGRVLGAMRSEIDRLSRLAADLLLLTQLEAGGGRLSPEAIDIRELFADLAEAARVMVGTHRVELDCPVALGVRADRDRLTQALLNLVDNAVRHTPAGGLVRLSGRRVRESVELEVLNEGPPIPADELPHLFDRFYRGRRATEPGRHAGLGLAIVKGIVAASGGSVSAASDPSGTRFVVRLPAHP